MACYLMAPSHYLNQCGLWLVISFCVIHLRAILQQVPKLLLCIANYCRISKGASALTHWGRVMHICVGKLNIIGSYNGLSPRRRQAIIWTNAGILLIRPLGTNFSEILFSKQTFSFKKMHLKMSSAKWRPFCLGLNELILLMLETEYSSFGCQCHACWCTGFFKKKVT